MKTLFVAVAAFFALVVGAWVVSLVSGLLATIIPALAARPSLAAFITICLFAVIGLTIFWFSQNSVSAGINYDEDCE